MVSFLRRPRRPRATSPLAASLPDPDLDAAAAAIRALNYRAERMRRAWLGHSLSAEQRIAIAEAEIARDSSRRW